MHGWLRDVKHRWTPDGSQAIIASLIIPRPPLGPARARQMDTQPIPIRAEGLLAEQAMRLQGRYVKVRGMLRRRYYSRDGEERWGQVELWLASLDVCEVEHGNETGDRE